MNLGMSDRPVSQRRPHHKTRNGCYQCKQRRVKCDEIKPQCGKCVKTSSRCNYPVAAGSRPTSLSVPQSTVSTPSFREPSPPGLAAVMTPSSPGLIDTDSSLQQYLEDLELMHFYTISTSSSFSTSPVRRQVWQKAVPQLAFSHKPLLNALLSLAALQLSDLQPHRKDALITKSLCHHNIALRSYVSQTSNITPENCHACFIFATIFASYSWASSSETNTLFFLDSSTSAPGGISIEWTQLIRGVLPLIRSSGDTLKNGTLKLLFEMWLPGVEQCKTMLPQDRSRLMSIAQIWESNPADYTAEEVESLSVALTKLEDVFDYIAPPNDGLCLIMITFSWLTGVSDIYLSMVGGRRPAALVILAHYCMLLGKIENECWWLRGMGRNLLDRIFKNLGEDWESWMSWPLQDLILREFRNHSDPPKSQLAYNISSPPINV